MLKNTTMMSVLAVAMAALLIGCIPVKDINAGWKRGKVDDRLAKTWVQIGKDGTEQASWLEFIPDPESSAMHMAWHEPERSIEEARRKAILVRTLETETDLYLVIKYKAKQSQKEPPKKDAAQKGMVTRYTMEKNRLTFYITEPGVLTKAVNDGEVDGEVEPGRASSHMDAILASLDEATRAWLGEIAKRDEAWKPIFIYTVEDNFEEAIKRARQDEK